MRITLAIFACLLLTGCSGFAEALERAERAEAKLEEVSEQLSVMTDLAVRMQAENEAGQRELASARADIRDGRQKQKELRDQLIAIAEEEDE